MLSYVTENRDKLIIFSSIFTTILVLMHFFILPVNTNVPNGETGIKYLILGLEKDNQLVINLAIKRIIGYILIIIPCILLITSTKFRDEFTFFIIAAVIMLISSIYTYSTINSRDTLDVSYNFILVFVILLSLLNIFIYFSDKIQHKLS